MAIHAQQIEICETLTTERIRRDEVSLSLEAKINAWIGALLTCRTFFNFFKDARLRNERTGRATWESEDDDETGAELSREWDCEGDEETGGDLSREWDCEGDEETGGDLSREWDCEGDKKTGEK